MLQADATRCAGITGFLAAGNLCAAFSTPFSAHTAPSLHAHAACALPCRNQRRVFFRPLPDRSRCSSTAPSFLRAECCARIQRVPASAWNANCRTWRSTRSMATLLHESQIAWARPRVDRLSCRPRRRRSKPNSRNAFEGEVRFDTGSRALYATDGSNYRQVPIGVVVPKTRRGCPRRRSNSAGVSALRCWREAAEQASPVNAAMSPSCSISRNT